MKDSVLIKLCRQLTKTDLRALRKVVRSPYFNQREDVVRLMDFIADNLSGDPAMLHRERASRSVFPGAAFDMPQLRYAMSFLLEIVRQYLAIEEMWADAAVERVYINSALKRRGAEDLIEKDLPDAFAANQKQPLRNSRFYFTEFQLLAEEFYQNAAQKRNTGADLSPLLSAFSAHQAIEVFKVAGLTISDKNFTGRQHEVPFLESAIALVESGKLNEKPAALLWYNVFKCLESPENEPNFVALKTLLPNFAQSLAPTEIAEIYLAAINFCIRRLNKGEEKYLREAFELYREGLESGSLMPNGVLSKYTYKNAMVAGARLREDEWAENFLEKYKQFLPEKEREDTHRFNLAFFLYSFRSDYDGALTLLQQVVQFGDPLYNLDARRMLVRIFYETKAITALEAQLDSYKAYLRRHKEIGYHREHHLNFIQTMTKFISTDLSKKENRRRLREKLEAEREIAERDWLLKQLAD